MGRKRKVWRSVLAGALIGFAEASRLDLQRRGLDRPPGVFRVARRLDPRGLIRGIPLILMDPITLEDAARYDTRRPSGRTGGRILLAPLRLFGGLGASRER